MAPIRILRRRKQKGVTLVEFAAALVLGLPLVVVMLYAVLEANLLFTIRTNLDAATRQAAQLLINKYAQTGIAAPDTSNGNLPSDIAFEVKAADGSFFISKTANQFTWTWDMTESPPTVTVTTSFPTGGSSNSSSGLMAFPAPDPLKLANKFSIITTATFSFPPG